MNPWRWVDPRALQVRIADLKAYLLAHGWVLKPNSSPYMRRFETTLPDGATIYQLTPAEDEEPDLYPMQVVEFLTTLRELEDRHPVALLDDVLAERDQSGLQAGTTLQPAKPVREGRAV